MDLRDRADQFGEPSDHFEATRIEDHHMLVPGNKMDFQVANAQERRDLVSFLEQSAGK